MARKEQLIKVEELRVFVESIKASFLNFSDALSEQDKQIRIAHQDKLLAAIGGLKTDAEQSSPFAMDPVPGFNARCEKVRAGATREYINNMRLMHKTFAAALSSILECEEQLKQRGKHLDIADAMKDTENLVAAFKRLGSKKLYEQDFSRVKEVIMKCDRVRMKAEASVVKAYQEVEQMISEGRS
jgi:hypothetical protein